MPLLLIMETQVRYKALDRVFLHSSLFSLSSQCTSSDKQALVGGAENSAGQLSYIFILVLSRTYSSFFLPFEQKYHMHAQIAVAWLAVSTTPRVGGGKTVHMAC